MHIPFTNQKVIQECQHFIQLVDHSSTSTPDDVESEQSPVREPVVDKSHGGRHAIETAHGVVDVLYENQRGAFLCGIPLFSAAGLWVTDPHAWLGMDFQYTPFTIFNASVPDPSWEWVWQRWFVDMSGDVDENGWSYNINFTRNHWHGHHIWYHAFVRRRRWFRKRRKVPASVREMRKRENPAEDYYTTYTASQRDNQGTKSTLNSGFANPEADQEDSNKVENLGDLYRRLRSARLDREKLIAVENFLQNGMELTALAGEMPHILRYMIYQESRKQLLAILAQQCQELEKHHEDSPAENEGVTPSRHQCVQNAIEVAESLVSHLNYYSDKLEVIAIEEDAELKRLKSVQFHFEVNHHEYDPEETMKSARDKDLDAITSRTIEDANSAKNLGAGTAQAKDAQRKT